MLKGFLIMDPQLQKYCFGRTLQLEPSCYVFICDEAPYLFFQSVCKHFLTFLRYYVIGMYATERNEWHIPTTALYSYALGLRESYWQLTENQCLYVLG